MLLQAQTDEGCLHKAGVKVTKENRKEIDSVIHSLVGVEYKDCSATWRAVKEHLAKDEGAFVEKLRKAL